MMIAKKMDNINIFNVGEHWTSSNTFACVYDRSTTCC